MTIKLLLVLVHYYCYYYHLMASFQLTLGQPVPTSPVLGKDV